MAGGLGTWKAVQKVDVMVAWSVGSMEFSRAVMWVAWMAVKKAEQTVD